VVVGSWLGAGCLGSPQPDPPNLDPSRLGTIPDVNMEIELVGAPGSATGSGDGLTATTTTGGLSVWFVNLDDAEPARTVAVAPDGSFSLSAVGVWGDEVRLQVRLGHERSEPHDVVLADPLGAAPRPLAGCLRTTPSHELSLGAAPSDGAQVEGDITIANDCADLVTLDWSMRVPGSPFAIVAAPRSLAPGEDGVVTVRFTASAGVRVAEEILFMRGSGPAEERRPFTLRAVGPP
jgi:hypothetical protein